MPSQRKFYRSVVHVEVLSRNSLSEAALSELSDLHYAITEGDCSGKVEITTHNQEVDGPTMAKLLQEQASDPHFFQLTEDGGWHKGW